jgi:hypothetical protein
MVFKGQQCLLKKLKLFHGPCDPNEDSSYARNYTRFIKIIILESEVSIITRTFNISNYGFELQCELKIVMI